VNNKNTKGGQEMILRLADQIDQMVSSYKELELLLLTETKFNTLRTGAFKLFKCTFPGSKQFKSTFILCFFKYL